MFHQSGLRLVPVSPPFALIMLRKVVLSTAPPPKAVSDEGEDFTSNYEEAIKSLNTLQSNAASIRQSIINKKNQSTLKETIKYLNRSGITLDQLDKLSVIHVAGTKGKGSTCALTESILRSYGIRTGFFSSPHLVSVTERIRINGKAICQIEFTRAFWKVFNVLQEHKESEKDMPPYFHFLTILCFHIFLEKNIEVAILEVGIGGENDCTNIVRNTSTVGITSLGLEHTNILGDTIEDIARQKSGIIKNCSNVYTNVKQPVCLDIIKKTVEEKNAKLYIVPENSEYQWSQKFPIYKFNKMIQLNGSLAMQLAYNWLTQFKGSSLNGLSQLTNGVTLSVSDQVIEGFNNCLWPGRCQIINFHNFGIHLDGAHTLESMDICTDWFQTVTKDSQCPKILIFNATGDRDSQALLRTLNGRVAFNLACFVPNIPLVINTCPDIHSVGSTNQDQLFRAKYHESNWRQLTGDSRREDTRLFGTVIEVFSYLNERFGGQKIDVLVTGSLHLLGAAIIALEEFAKRHVNT